MQQQIKRRVTDFESFDFNTASATDKTEYVFTKSNTDRGISRGMQLGIDFAKEQGKSVEFRKLPNYP